nr:MAG TPA: hypothetical protein [Bacteriophage sp.]
MCLMTRRWVLFACSRSRQSRRSKQKHKSLYAVVDDRSGLDTRLVS